MAISVAKGVTLDVNAETVAHITKIDGVDQTAETLDVSTLDSTDNYAKFIGGQKDGGEVPIDGYFDAADTGQQAVMSAYDSGDAVACAIHFPTAVAKKWSFDAVVTEFKTGFELNSVIPFTAKLKISGKPTLDDET